MKRSGLLCHVIAMVISVILLPSNTNAYSVLTHEALIDFAWNESIRPLLLAKFPNATDHQLIEAHAYAYGGSAVQDMGYYPFGKVFFSNLTHYVRSGDFVARLLKDAKTLNEYAFAIGALSHYLGDSIGHSEAINLATAMEFPKLKAKYGDSVTYGESPHSHIRTEFAFDVEELSDRHFAPAAYLERVGFKVPRTFLRQVFIETYGIDIAEVLGKARPDLKSYRTSVRTFIPAFAEAEVVLHKKQFPPHPDTEAFRKYAERVARTNYQRRWRHTYKGPGFKAHLLAVLVFIVPKIGAASDLAIKIPNSATQEWYVRSVNRTVDRFREILQQLRADGDPQVRLTNLDLDTGERVRLGDYALADKTYEELLARLTSKPRRGVPAGVKQNVLEYYEGSLSITDANDPKPDELNRLKSMSVRGSRELEGGAD
jgi:Zinc dependent phospholipase C